MRNTDRIARKNVRITFQKNKAIIDKYQNHINTWYNYFSCFAYADTYSLSESGEEIITEESQKALIVTKLRISEI